MIHLYVYQEIGSGLRHKKPSIDKMNELNAQYGLDIRKDAKHLRDKYHQKKNEKGPDRVAPPTEDDAALSPIQYDTIHEEG